MAFRSAPTHSSDQVRSADPVLGSSSRANQAYLDLVWQRLIWFWSVFGIAWLLIAVHYGWVARTFRYEWPYSTFLFVPNDVYSDLTLTWRQSQAANPYVNNETGVAAAYFPFAYSVLKLYGKVSREALILGYIGLTFVSTLGVWMLWLRKQWGQWRGDSRRPVIAMLSFGICVCNYPLLIALDRGNTDPITMALAFLACELAFARRSALGAVFLALGAAAKAFPLAAILVLLRRRRRCRAALLASGAFMALVLVPLALLPGPVKANLHAFLENLAAFRRGYVLGNDSCHYSSDWLNAWRALALYKSWNPRIPQILPWYERAMFAWAGVMATLALFVLRDRWRELLAIGVIILVFPNVTNDYKLVFLLPAILHWLSSNASGWRNQVFLASSALLLLPKHFWFLIPGHGTSVSCLINPVLVTAMSAVLWPTSYERALAAERLRGFGQRVFGRKPVMVRG